ncbi:MAG: hypothetical protein ACJAVT_000622 [Yoonia sp.]|jgi:hypothetical protein
MIGIKAKDVPCTIGKRANRTHADRLEKRSNPCKKHRHLDQVGHIRKALHPCIRPETKAGSARDYNGRCHVRHKHRQYVLDAQGNGTADPWKIVRITQLLWRSYV